MKIIITKTEAVALAREVKGQAMFLGIDVSSFMTDEQMFKKIKEAGESLAKETRAFSLDVTTNEIIYNIDPEFMVDMIKVYGGIVTGFANMALNMKNQNDLIISKYSNRTK